MRQFTFFNSLIHPKGSSCTHRNRIDLAGFEEHKTTKHEDLPRRIQSTIMASKSSQNEKSERDGSPPPQLARKCYTVDASSSDDSSLEIMSPNRKRTHKVVSNTNNIAVKKTDKDEAENCHTDLLNRCDLSQHPSEDNDDNDDADSTVDLQLNRKRKPAQSVTETTKASDRVKSTKFSLPSSDDDDDDDDELLLNSKPAAFESKSSIKERRKKNREALKLLEKQARADKRQLEKEERERLKKQEIVGKKRRKEELAQATGKYRHQEIAVLLDPTLYMEDSCGIVQSMSNDFLMHSFPSMLSLRSDTAITDLAAIQFIRRDYLDGGAQSAISCLESSDKDGYEHLHNLILVIEADDFIPLLRREDKDEDDDFPALEAWLLSIQSRWRQVWGLPRTAVPKMLLLLRNLPDALDKKWIDHQRRHRNEPSLPTQWELMDATQWLLVQFQVECMFCPTPDLIQITVHKMTRALSDKPYANQVSELECIKKIKHNALPRDNPMHKARDVWLRQLQQIPGISETKAQNIVEHYPTCQSLWQAYKLEGGGRNSTLLASVFSGGIRNEPKLSDAVFKVMTSNEPEEMIL